MREQMEQKPVQPSLNIKIRTEVRGKNAIKEENRTTKVQKREKKSERKTLIEEIHLEKQANWTVHRKGKEIIER